MASVILVSFVLDSKMNEMVFNEFVAFNAYVEKLEKLFFLINNE